MVHADQADANTNPILEAHALKSPTHVYASRSTSSAALKSYRQGTLLKFREHDKDWYSASVHVNGKIMSGFISKMDVSASYVNDGEVFRGIGLKDRTNVYSNLSTGSSVLKSYNVGSVLAFRKLTDDWYVANVTVNRVVRTGYIHKDDIELVNNPGIRHDGISLPNQIHVRSLASANASSLKSYPQGSKLIYRSFSENWFSATVIVGGQARTGYIHKSEVEDFTPEQRSLRGIGLMSPTAVYSRASTSSSPLKTYGQGRVLSFKTLTTNWYEATVIINGKPRVGYINTEHMEVLREENEELTGVAMKNPTNVYSLATRNAAVISTYNKPNQMKLKTYSQHWFTTTVTVNGRAVTGYVHIDDFSADRILTTTTAYSTAFKSAVDIQMTRAPQVSGKTGGWVNASRSQVEYYVNSSNFDKNSSHFFQFLVLSQPAGLDVNEINQKILHRSGTLTGQAQAFIDAGKKYSANEAYLIAHAILETGHGSSPLAAGVPVDNTGKVVAKEQAVHTVYNMYGIGAIDSCPLTCGAKTAFDRGWFTPQDAIIGGADFISTYLNRGQDTIYKMRWNPISPGFPQYATDIAWATKQTPKIKEIYDMLENFVLIFDVPSYGNQPTTSGNPNAYLADAPASVVAFPAGTVGENSVNLNFRDKPTTSGSTIIMNIPNGSTIELLGSNGTWFNARFGGKTGWVHGDYISVLNLLEVNVPTLNVRPNPNTTGTALGALKSGEFVSGVLNKDKKLVRSGVWYQINYKGSTGWVSGGTATTKYIIER